MPYFAQEPLSYLTLPTIRNAYKTFTIRVTFRPDNVDGESAQMDSSCFVVHFSTLNPDCFYSLLLTVFVVFPHGYFHCVSCPPSSPSPLLVGRSHIVRW